MQVWERCCACGGRLTAVGGAIRGARGGGGAVSAEARLVFGVCQRVKSALLGSVLDRRDGAGQTFGGGLDGRDESYRGSSMIVCTRRHACLSI